MTSEPIQIRSVEVNDGGGGAVIDILPANPRRVYVISQLLSATGQILFCRYPGGLLVDVFSGHVTRDLLEFLHHDYGELVTGEWHLCDGFGKSPAVHAIITEAVLT